MTRTRLSRAAMALIVSLPAAAARAQTPAAGRAFIDVNAGVAVESGAIETSRSFSLFGETGAVATRVTPPSGALVDARIGTRVGRRIGFAVAVSGGRSEAEGRATASVPSPIRFASPSIVALDAPGLKRREIGYHVQALWFMPVGQHLSVAVFGGPSVIRLQQAIAGIAVDSSTPVITATNESGTALGANGGLDVAYWLHARYGVGFFARYAAGSVNLPSASSVKVGGFQGGGGLRLRF